MQEVGSQYHLARELARKYSHSTYLATPTDKPDRQVVLTMFASSRFHSPLERENLLQKVQRIKELQHPHLMPILDIGIEQEQPFVVHEYLPKGSLRSDLKNIAPKGLELERALIIVLQVGEALAYAHEHNITHGNIKPENILLDANDEVLLTDFYLLTREDVIIRDQVAGEYGFCYLAPEQFAGICDTRSDQYALGCLAYELITGQVPFASQTLASMMGSPCNMVPAALSETIPDLPPSLEIAVLKALAQDPDQRFFDFLLFLEVIQSVLSPVPAFPLLRSNYVRKNKTISHRAQSAKIESPIRKRAAKVDDSPHWALKEQEHNEASAIPLESVPELAFSVFECPGAASIAEEAADDVLLTDPFEEEGSSASFAIIPISLAHEQSESKPSKMSKSLAIYADMPRPRIVQALRDKKRLLGLVLFFSIISALLTYAFWPSGILTPDTSLYKSIHNKSTVDPELVLVPAQRDNSIPIPTAVPTPNLSAVARADSPVLPKSSLMVVPTPGATAVAADSDPYAPYNGTLVLSDPLKDNSRGYGWNVTPPASSNGGESCQFTGGAYYAYSQDNLYNNCRPSIKPSNFTFEVQMQIVSGDCGGLTLRDGGDANAYSYQVCQDGSYQFNIFANGSIQTLASASNAAITAGLSQSNLIAIVADGSSFDLYVNHQKLTSVNDSTYTTGMFGLTSGNSNVAYTNARMWTL